MTVTLHAVTFDCGDPNSLAAFWAKFLGRDVDPHQLDGLATIGYNQPARPFFVFAKVDGGKVGTKRVHPDFATKDLETESEGVLALGATRIRDVAEHGVRFTTVADPEGNLFDLADE